MVEKIKIRKHTEGDSNANIAHRLNVRALMKFCAEELKVDGDRHDWTKTNEPFARIHDLCGTIVGETKFIDGKWVAEYCEECYYLNEYCVDDFNMFDVIEVICEGVAAGMARSGEVCDVDIPSDVLKRAVSNTVEYLKGYVEVTE